MVSEKTRATSVAQLVHRGHDDVARRLVVELLDALAEIGLHDLDAAGFEKRPHVALVGQHRLRLDQRARAARLHDVEHDLVVLGGVPCPMHVRAVARRVALEFLEVVGEVGQRVFLDRRGQRAQLLPFGKVLALAVALLAQVPQPLVVEFDVVLRLDELRRGFGVVDALHACGSVQDLRDVNELDRQAQPLGATLLVHHAGHVGGDDVLGAGAMVVVDLVVAHPGRHRLLEYRERSAEAAAFVGPFRRDELDPLHLGQQVHAAWRSTARRSRTSWPRASARSVEQPLCRPTLCGNSAHGNAWTLTTSCRNSTSS